MTSDPIQGYQESLRALNAAWNRVEALIHTIVDAGHKLERNWQDVRVANVDVPFPIELPLNQSINAKDWPTAQELAMSLAAWHSAHHAMGNAWRAIPREHRVGLQPPSGESTT